jgi:hypothetical protein
MTHIVCSHPELAHDVARLLVTAFRDSNDGSTIVLKQLPDLLEELYLDDIFLCYEALTYILPEIDKINPETYQSLIRDSNLIANVLKNADQL